jgi:hypothetical protein
VRFCFVWSCEVIEKIAASNMTSMRM